MKVAVCLSGQPRFIEYGYPIIYNNLIAPNSADVFFHTWFDREDANKQFRSDGQWGADPRNKIDPETEEKLVKLYNPCGYVCEKQRTFKNSRLEMDKTIKTYVAHLKRDYFVDMMYCMWYSIYQANMIKEIYRLENDIHYDYVIRCRFDAILPRPLLCSELDPNTLWLSHDRQTPNQLDDWFALGSNNTMNIYTNGFNIMDYLYDVSMKRDGLFCNENLAYELVKRFELPWKIIPNFKIEFIRPWMVPK